MEKKVREFLSSLSTAQKAVLLDRLFDWASSLDFDHPSPYYECRLQYRYGDKRWKQYVAFADLTEDSIVIQLSDEPCTIDESLGELACGLFSYLCEGVYPFSTSLIRIDECYSEEVQE